MHAPDSAREGRAPYCRLRNGGVGHRDPDSRLESVRIR